MTHARVYVATAHEEISQLGEFKVQGADVEHFVIDRFGIDDARLLTSRAMLRPVERNRRDFLLQFSVITNEAQNALLKLLEDPPDKAVFHLVVPDLEILLPTLRSRLSLVGNSTRSQTKNDEFEAFKQLPLGERISLIEKKTKASDLGWVEVICGGIEASAHIEADRSLLEAVMFVRKYLKSRGASNKMLLEYLSLKLPIYK